MRRLILEVQHARMTITDVTALLGKVERAARRADFGRLTNEAAPLRDVCAIAWAEMLRAGLVDVPRPSAASVKGAAGFDYDPDEAEDRRIEEMARMIARAHRKQ
ncbi:hypothetical protein SAMN05444172_2564 [Burkholderia sp. GAS332]|nr:hypothetical protein SAMN05444172_2564 [Burkholderia sp. GAS332]